MRNHRDQFRRCRINRRLVRLQVIERHIVRQGHHGGRWLQIEAQFFEGQLALGLSSGGCRFRLRCPIVHERSGEMPPLLPVGPNHEMRCWLAQDGRP